MGYTIRHAVPEDTPHLVRFMEGLQRVEEPMNPDRAPAKEMAASHVAFLLGEVAENGGCTFVAIPDGSDQPIGFALSSLETFGGTYIREEVRRSAWIHDLWVDEEHRGGEVVDLLFAATEEHYRAMGIKRLMIVYVDGNDRAGRAYLKRGFKPYESILERPID